MCMRLQAAIYLAAPQTAGKANLGFSALALRDGACVVMVSSGTSAVLSAPNTAISVKGICLPGLV